jgi:predicted nucleic acid-binding protein
MAASVLADSSFLVALLNVRDTDHEWAATQAIRFPPPWKTCEAALSEAFHLLGTPGMLALAELVQDRAVVSAFDGAEHIDDVLRLMKKYSDVPMSFTHGCLVRMSEVLSNPTILTTDADFHVYRRHGRQVVPCITPR